MRTLYGIMALAAFGTMAHAELDAKPVEQAAVVVQVENASRARAYTIYSAEAIASSLFAPAGVTVEWRKGNRAAPLGSHPILITLQENTPVDYRPGAMAFARVFEGIHITVFYDRIAETGAPPDVLLAYVLVHEITHVLQGVDRHSDRGIMKAHWTRTEHFQMKLQTLAFTDDDIQLIHMGLAMRNTTARR
jgi:hypothetical protein